MKVRPELRLAVLSLIGEYDPLQRRLVSLRYPQLRIDQFITQSEMIAACPSDRGLFHLVGFTHPVFDSTLAFFGEQEGQASFRRE